MSLFQGPTADCELTPAINEDTPAEVAEKYSWPFFKDEQYNRAMQKYMFSFKNIYSPNINASNLMFVTGPTQSGKSYYLRHNMQTFTSTDGHRPVVFHYDFNELDNININFDTFLVNFENMLID